MPSGGLSELRRRKEEAERAANEPSADSTSGSAPEPQPGELQHVSTEVEENFAMNISEQ